MDWIVLAVLTKVSAEGLVSLRCQTMLKAC